ncbi:unnamed protein product, partial [Polarella glacialis]
VVRRTSGKKPKKSMKAKRVSKVARGRLAKVMVFRGRRERTVGGLRKDSLVVNKRGRIVSKRASAHGKLSFKRIETWVQAVMAARRAVNAKGFIAINGKKPGGRELYAKAKELRAGKLAEPLSSRRSAKDAGASDELKAIFAAFS